MTLRSSALLLVLAVAACKKEAPPAPPPPPPAPTMPNPHAQETAGKPLHWTDPAGWEKQPPKSSMRQAQYSIPKVGNDPENAELVVFYFGPGQGGSVQDNLTRWEGQFAHPEGASPSEAAKTEKKTINGIPVTLVQVQGIYANTSMMGPSGPPREHWALLGAIAETPSGPWFFKMTGPEATVAAARPAFEKLVESFKVE